jgi:hypothetical protein
MSSQTTLTENAPMILDATCSDKKIWPRYASIRMDVRKEMVPDVCADARFLPFRDEVFQRIYCDPPHFIRSDARMENMKASFFSSVNRKRYPHDHWMNSMARYGYFPSREAWNDFIRATNQEFARCLRSSGDVEYKITDGPKRDMTTLAELLSGMSAFGVIKDRVTLSPFGKKPVHWLTMKPIEPTGASAQAGTLAKLSEDNRIP